MRNDGCLFALMLIGISAISAVSGFAIATNSWHGEMKQRGLMQHNQQTGVLEWTEKAGGERRNL